MSMLEDLLVKFEDKILKTSPLIEPFLKLCCEMVVKLNSTYLILENTLLTTCQVMNFVNWKNFLDVVVEDFNWRVFQTLHLSLKNFNNSTNLFSDSCYPTTNLTLYILL